MSEPISFIATIYKVQTTVDFGIRITLDMPESHIMQMAMLAECRRAGVALDVTAYAITQNEVAGDTPDGKKGRSATKSLRGG